MKTSKLYQHIASALCAMENCRRSGNTEWLSRHEANIETLCKDFMPSGSGIDCGTRLDWDASSCERQTSGEYPSRLVFSFSFHHMNESGMYDGWTEHKLIVRPSLVFGIDLKITGRDRNGIKEYLYDVFQSALDQDIEHTVDGYSRVSS
jgi:hypothetical protein